MFLLDTNIFIASSNVLPEDVWPSFWVKLAEQISIGNFVTSIKVKEELDKGYGFLTDWIKANAPKSFFKGVDINVMQEYAKLQQWASSRQYRETAVKEFAEVADSFIVATASANNWTLVTNETSSPESKKRIKIPDACDFLGVKYCNLNDAFRSLGVSI